MTAKHLPRKSVFAVALAAALFAAAPAFAQEQTAPETPDTVEADASVTKDSLVAEYADALFAGDEVAAGDAVAALRTGSDFTIVTTETRQATNADGSLATNPDGTPKMETVTVETVVANPNGPMGWGEVDHSLGLAQALVENGEAGSLEEALAGAPVTNADGTTTYEGGILQMRADGMGWGQIAKELGFKSLGEIKSGRAFADDGASAEGATASADKTARGRDTARDKSTATRGKSEVARADRAGSKPERVERVARVERPEKPERPERPAKPERVGRP